MYRSTENECWNISAYCQPMAGPISHIWLNYSDGIWKVYAYILQQIFTWAMGYEKNILEFGNRLLL